ncbi:hypothetical protein, partial [Klebsiella aerogenes]|uniref:hypothetical protein n=1 Tax=Klebsiella aerogenes TaxID=548 RepID=UPI001954E9E4
MKSSYVEALKGFEHRPSRPNAKGGAGTSLTLFGKVHRIVTHARGAADGSAFTQSLEAWRTGMFEGRYVFGEADPGRL